MAGELILIVEDNEKNRKLERDVLQFHGFRTVEAETGEEGVRLALESAPALILMDIQLPGIDGIEALRRLRAAPATRGIPVIAVTASAMTHDRQKIMAAGFDAYQSKPINVKEFVETVRRTLGRAAAAGGPA
jgi:CheY-like chemotaxis protein